MQMFLLYKGREHSVALMVEYCHKQICEFHQKKEES
jgi:hypothetical protein